MSWPVRPGPRGTIGERLFKRFLAGEFKEAHFGRGRAPGGDAGATFHMMDQVWLWLATEGLKDPFTGAAGVWAKGMVLEVNHDRSCLVVLERYLLKGTVPANRLRKRLPGEIAPGRTELSAGRPKVTL